MIYRHILYCTNHNIFILFPDDNLIAKNVFIEVAKIRAIEAKTKAHRQQELANDILKGVTAKAVASVKGNMQL